MKRGGRRLPPGPARRTEAPGTAFDDFNSALILQAQKRSRTPCGTRATHATRSSIVLDSFRKFSLSNFSRATPLMRANAVMNSVPRAIVLFAPPCFFSVSLHAGEPDLAADAGLWQPETSMKSELLQRITIEEGKCGGRPCIRGKRIRVTDILGLLSAGASFEEILQDYSFLQREDILAAIEYAARQTDHVVLQTS